MPIMQISVVPLGTKIASLSSYVADIIKMLKKEKNIRYELTSMSTIVEADSLDTLLKVAKKMHKIPFNKGAVRVVTSIAIDDRRDKKISIRGKLDSVKKKLK